ncbi:MAG: DinB family protein [Actinomycetota bacterium]|nr:DinB family protein [Actinomycetota bacterium]
MTELAPLPAVAVDERTSLIQFLDYFRSVLLRKADGLSEAQARIRIEPSTMDLLGLVRHMAVVEQGWFTHAFLGSEEPTHWEDPDDDDSDWHHTPADTLADGRATLLTEIEKSRAAAASAPTLEHLTAIEVGPPDNPDRYGRRALRWVMIHMIEEYARHCGHADLIRERIDGATGD